MPRIKRYFPVSQDINEDDELWEFTKTFGDRAFRTWMEILKILDKNENRFRISDEGYASLSRRLRQSSANLRRQVGWLLARGWLASGDSLASGLPSVLYSPNYAKYHNTREHNGTPKLSHNAPLLTDPSRSDPLKSPKKDSPRNPSEVSVFDFCESWNRCFIGKLPAIRLPLSPSRDRKLRMRLKEHPAEQFWTEVFTAIAQSDFLMGKNGNGRAWRASFDWIIENDKNCLKVAEGNYANKH